jgi:hypothetical protein
MRQTKRLTPEQFELAVRDLNVGEKTIYIAEAVLVQGRPQTELRDELKLSKGAVSQAVDRVWQAAQHLLPQGLLRITATLPPHQVRIVRQWEKQAMEKRGTKP